MTRLAAFLVVLSLLSTSTARAEQREPAKKTWSAKKKGAPKKASRSVKQAPPPSQSVTAPEPLPAARAVPASYKPEAAPEAVAQQPAQDAPMQGTPAEESSDDDFDLLEPLEEASKAQMDPALERKIGRRRTMLKLHQGLGFAMTAGLITTTVVGQLQFNDSFRGGGDDRNLLGLHRGLAIGTSALFASVGLLGLLAPEPFEKQFQWDTITFHKILMSIATVGMLAQVVLGIMATDRYGRLSETDFATAHQVVGYTTLGAVSAGVLTLFF